MPGSPPDTPYLGIPRYSDADDASFSAQVNAISDTVDASMTLLQPGDLVMSAASSRSGCLLCNGSAVSRTTYAALFSAIGTTYGTGDGSTTFNVPDYQGRTIIGAGSGSGLTARSRGQTGGEETHALSATEMPPHTHQVTNTPTATVTKTAGGDNCAGPPVNTVTTTSAGGSGGSVVAHNNMQPYAVANVFVKT